MKTFIAVCLMAPFLMFGGDAAGQSAASAKRPAKKAVAKQKPGVGDLPPGAVKVDETTWHWKAPDGRMWLYRKTPFGLSRGVIEEKSDKPEDLPPGMFAIDDGDSVRFERPSPFGPLKWTRPKSELTETERLVWERDCRKSATATAEGQPKAAPAGSEDQKEKKKQ